MAGRAATDAVIRGRCAISVNDPGHQVPSGWIRVPLLDVAELGTGHTPSRQHPEYWDGDIPWIGIRDAGAHHGHVINQTAQRITELGLANSAARLLPKHTICLSRTASVGYITKLGREMATSQDFVTWTCGDPLDPDFLMKALLAEGEGIRRFGEGSTHTTIYFPEVKAFNIDLPPLAEQRRIVAKLDTLMARLTRARTELDRSLLLAKRMRDQTLGKAYAQAAANCQLQPISYFISKLDQGWSPKCENYPSLSDDEWAVLKTTAVQPLRYLAHENKLLPRALRPRAELEVAVGDILVTRAGPRVRVGISCLIVHTRPKLILADKMYRLRVRADRAIPEFLVMSLNAPQLLEGIEPLKTGISDSGLNLTQEKFLSLRVPAISIAQQRDLIASVQASFARIDRLEAEAARGRGLLDRLEAAILAKAFRGELVPQDPNDEPASVLLERIRAQRHVADKPKRHARQADAALSKGVSGQDEVRS